MSRKERIRRFRRAAWAHYARHGRVLPWRNTHDPYKIWISEIMLQQTQVQRVIPKYKEFLQEFPTVAVLSRAPLRRVLSRWQGLGYNRRGVALRKAAEAIAALHGGSVPRDYAALRALPGIGDYTARAIRIFAFDEAEVCIETNIRRAAIHHFFPRATQVPDEALIPLLEDALDEKRSREWHYALMDYGAMLGETLRRRNPNRQSTAYRAQSPFRGSFRELRGALLKQLLREERVTLRRFLAGTGREREACEKAFEALVREGVAKQQGEALVLL